MSLLRADPRLSEVAAASPEEVPVLASSELGPQVVLLSALSPYTRSVLAAVRAAAPEARVIALGVAGGEAEIVAWLELGFVGYVPMESSLEELCTAIQAASRDEMVCAPNVAFALLKRVHELHAGSRTTGDIPHLTPREQEILELLELGLSNKEIARRLSIRALTVKNHVHHILKKLGARRRGEAAACRRRWAPDPPRGGRDPGASPL
jgi:DNA-binding NarL/FixJ family response regulator